MACYIAGKIDIDPSNEYQMVKRKRKDLYLLDKFFVRTSIGRCRKRHTQAFVLPCPDLLRQTNPSHTSQHYKSNDSAWQISHIPDKRYPSVVYLILFSNVPRRGPSLYPIFVLVDLVPICSGEQFLAYFFATFGADHDVAAMKETSKTQASNIHEILQSLDKLLREDAHGFHKKLWDELHRYYTTEGLRSAGASL